MLKDYLVNKPIIENDRIILRPFKDEDVDDLKDWTPDISIYKYWGKNPGKYDLNPELLIGKKDKPSKSFHLYIYLKKDKKVVGDIYIYLIEKDIKAKIAIRINKKYHRKGIGKSAVSLMIDWIFINTELTCIWTDVDINNIASIKLLESVGFIQTKKICDGKMVSTIADFYIYELNKKTR